MQNALTAQYADVANGSTHNGALIQSWDYTGLTNQRWSLEYVQA